MGGRGRLERDGIYVYLWLICVVVQQKPTQCCKAIFLQLKKKLKKNGVDKLAQHRAATNLQLKKKKALSVKHKEMTFTCT